MLLAAYLAIKIYTINHNPVIITKSDTVKIIVSQDPIIIDTAEAKLVYRTKLIREIDTLIIKEGYEELKFTASIDTVANSDTISVNYFYPENFFNLSIRQKPDTIRTITIFKDKILKKEQSIWEAGLYVLGGFLVGYVIAK